MFLGVFVRFCAVLHVSSRFVRFVLFQLIGMLFCTVFCVFANCCMFLRTLSCFCMVFCVFLCFCALGALLGAPGTLFGRSWAFFGRSWGCIGPVLGALGRSWGTLGALLGRSWTYVGPILQKMCPKSGSYHFFGLQLGRQNGAKIIKNRC